MFESIKKVYNNDKTLFLGAMLMIIPMFILVILLFIQLFLLTFYHSLFVSANYFNQIFFIMASIVIIGLIIFQYRLYINKKIRYRAYSDKFEKKYTYPSWLLKSALKEADILSLIEKRLVDAGAALQCPRCNNKQFTIVNGFFYYQIVPANQLIKDEKNANSQIPYVISICSHCGFISQHSLVALGLVEKEKDADGYS